MSQDSAPTDAPDSPVVESPPVAACPVEPDACDQARQHLHRLADQLRRHHSRRLMIEYLRLRQSLR